jgi:hypothetical protein
VEASARPGKCSSAPATLLQLHADETKRGRIMALFGLINRGLGPMGSFSFGLIATSIGAPWTTASCGLITVAAVAYFAFFRSALGRVHPMIEPITFQRARTDRPGARNSASSLVWVQNGSRRAG